MITNRTFYNIGKDPVLGLVEIEPPYEISQLALENEARLVYVEEGRSVFHTPSGKFQLSKGDSALICSGNFVNNWVKTSGDQNSKAIILRLLPQHVLKTESTSRSEKTLAPAYKIESNDLIETYIQGIKKYIGEPGLLNEEFIKLKLNELLLLLHSLKDIVGIPEIKEVFNPQEFQISQVVEAHLFENLSVEELAHLSNQSLSSFHRKFREVYDKSPKQYIITQRLNKAKSMLGDPESRISDVAYQSGFDDPANFSKSFTSHFGISPSQFKKSLLT